jgi:hypothetical protein
MIFLFFEQHVYMQLTYCSLCHRAENIQVSDRKDERDVSNKPVERAYRSEETNNLPLKVVEKVCHTFNNIIYLIGELEFIPTLTVLRYKQPKGRLGVQFDRTR